MTVDFNEIAVKNGYKEFLFVAVTEEGEIVAHYPENVVASFGLVAVAKRLIEATYQAETESEEKDDIVKLNKNIN